MPIRLWILALVTLTVVELSASASEPLQQQYPPVPSDILFPTTIDYAASGPDAVPLVGEETEPFSTAESLREFQFTLDQFQTKLDAIDKRMTITSRDKDWSLTIFGALTGEMIYAEQRPVLPSAIVLISPDTGRDAPTFDIHAKSSSLGMTLQGPEICGMQSGMGVVTFFFGENFLSDQQGLFIPRAYAELKNDDWRFACGALGDVINPRLPGTLDFNHGQAAGNLGYFRGQFRAERYIHFSDDAQHYRQVSGIRSPPRSWGTSERWSKTTAGPTWKAASCWGWGRRKTRGHWRDAPSRLPYRDLADRFAALE